MANARNSAKTPLWQPPSEEKLKEFLSDLKYYYSAEAGSARENQVNFLNSMEDKNPDILFGAIITVQEIIKKGYSFCGIPSTMFGVKIDSELYGWTELALNIRKEDQENYENISEIDTDDQFSLVVIDLESPDACEEELEQDQDNKCKNEMDEASRFICLLALVEHLESVSKNEVEMHFFLQAQKFLKECCEKMVNEARPILTRLPDCDVLKRNFSTLAERYEDSRKNPGGLKRWLSYVVNLQRKERRDQIKFLEAMKEILSEKEMEEEKVSEEMLTEELKLKHNEDVWFTRFGGLMYVMNDIGKEGTFGKPNSNLYREIQRTAHIDHELQVDPKLLQDALLKFEELIHFEMRTPERLARWKKCEVDKEELQKIAQKIFKHREDIMKHREEDFVGDPSLNRTISRMLEWLLASTSQSAAFFGICQLAWLIQGGTIPVGTILSLMSPQALAMLAGSVILINHLRGTLVGMAARKIHDIVWRGVHAALEKIKGGQSAWYSADPLDQTELDARQVFLLLTINHAADKYLSKSAIEVKGEIKMLLTPEQLAMQPRLGMCVT